MINMSASFISFDDTYPLPMKSNALNAVRTKDKKCDLITVKITVCQSVCENEKRFFTERA